MTQNPSTTAWDVIQLVILIGHRKESPQGPLSRHPDMPACTAETDGKYEDLLCLCQGVDPRLFQAARIYLLEYVGTTWAEDDLVDFQLSEEPRWKHVALKMGLPYQLLMQLREHAEKTIRYRLDLRQRCLNKNP